MLCFQERSQDKINNDPEQGGKGQMSSVHSESISDKPASGPMLVDLTRSESVSDKLASGEPMLVIQQTITDSEFMHRVFQNVKNRFGHNEGVSQMVWIRTNISMWTLFMVSSMEGALHMDPSDQEI